jgi:trimeric autotransporter adhesin
MANEFKIKNGLIVSGSADFEQDLRVRGTLTVDELHTSITTSSIIYESGSTRFGDTIDDSHTFTGSVLITGSISLNGEPIGTGKLNETTFNSYTSSISSSIGGLSSSIATTTSGLTSTITSLSSSLTSSIGSLSSSVDSINNTQNGRLDSLETASGSIRTDFNSFTSSYTTVSGSIDSRLDVLEAYSGSQLVPSSSMSFRTLQTDVYCKNVTGTQINKGTVVRIVGSTGDNPLIGVADPTTEHSSANVLGIATVNIPNDSFGLVITEGVLVGVNTNGMTAGDLLYLGVGGTFTTTPTIAPNHGVRLGEVLRVQQNNGSIYVRIDNGIELNEAHDVIYSSGITHGDLLIRSGSVWKNSKSLEGNYLVTGSVNITGGLTGSIDYSNITNKPTLVSSSAQVTTYGFATTGSNLFIGNQTHSGSIIPSVDNEYDLGSATHQWRDVYISSGSLYIDGTKVISSTSQELQITTDNGQSIKILEGGTDSIILQTADGDIELKSNADGDILLDPTNGKIMLKGTVEILNGNKIQSSVNGTPVVFANDIVVSGSIDITGTIEGINLTDFSSSVNNRIGNLETSAGSLNSFTSSANSRLSSIETSTSSLNSFTSSINTTIKSKLDSDGVISGSVQVNITGTTGYSTFSSSLASTDLALSSRITVLDLKTGSYATTGSNIFQGNQTITGSLYVSQDLIIAGSSSIQHISSSVVNIADNIITVNAQNPSIRFGGLAVIDSGSSPQVSGSMLFDSVNDQWIFVHQNQLNVTSSVLLMGPQTFNSLGNESYPTTNRILKSVNAEHVGDSNISDNGTDVSINSNTKITGSLLVTNTIVSQTTPLVSGSAQISFNGITDKPTLVSGSSQVLNGSGVWSGSAQLPSGVVSGSSQVLSGTGIWSGSAQLPSGIVSGSSQITFGSISSIPGGLVSGSSQIDLTATTNYSTGIKTRLNAEGVLSGSSQVTGIGNSQLTNSSFFVGTTSISLGRTSASQTLTGVSIDGNAATVSNGVYTTGDQSIGGAKTFTFTGVAATGTINLVSDDTFIRFRNTLRATDDKQWDIRAVGTLDFRTINDANNVFSTALSISRAGNLSVTGTIGASNYSGTHSGTSSGTNTGDQTNISGNAATVTNGVYTNANNTITGGNKIVIQNSTDGGTSRGIFMWNSTDPNWGIYMSQAGASKTIAGTTAPSGIDGRIEHAIRFRVASSTGQIGFLWENSDDAALMQLQPNTGNLYTRGQIYAGNSTSNLVLHTGNYNSYALPLNGGQLNGLVTMSDNAYFTGAPTHGFRWNSSNNAFNNVIMRDNGNVEVRGSLIAGSVGSTPQARLQVVGDMRWSSGGNSYYTYSDMDGNGLYIETLDNNTGRAKMRFQTRVNNSGAYTTYQIDASNSQHLWIINGNTRLTMNSGGDLLPGANGTQNLGSASLRWNTVFTSDLSLSNGIGDYTIVEGEEKLYLYNNKNNKVYSFVLQEEDPATATPKKS